MKFFSERMVVLVWLWMGVAFAQEKAPVTYAWEDPTKIKTANTCRQCHTSEYEVWSKTAHARGFKSLHRKKAAEEIAKKMGFNLIKRESLCLTCHYTPTVKNDTLRAISGVSCESCHGASADWLNIHNQYGGKGFTFENETEAHKKERIETTRKLGMRRPSDLYPVASRCFQCHTVPQEKLVNVGGHGTGSSDFELVAWSQGEIRHNFFESFLTGDGTINAERSPERKRLMYVLGRALDVEYTVRGLAVAKEKKRYFKAMSRRLRQGVNELRAIQKRSNIAQVTQILTMVRQAKIVPDQNESLMNLATQIGEVTQVFLTEHDGSKLSALDGLVAGEVDDDFEDVSDAVSVASTASGDTAAEERAPIDGTEAQPIKASPTRTGQSIRTVKAIAAVGAKKSKIRPESVHKTIGPGKCSSCHRHETQSTWWFDDRHYATADPFLEQKPEFMKIARLYGLSDTQVSRGTAVCMDCHGTVVSGKERREITDGVSCESCHGPAADYLDPHQEGEPSQGLQRKGYLAAIKLGMIGKGNAQERAKACASCHYITDERLLSAGHQSGKDFDYLKGLTSIKHWETASLGNDVLGAAYQNELKRRGSVPQVQLAREAEVIKAVTTNSKKQKRDLAATLRDPNNKKVARPAIPKARPVSKAASSQSTSALPLDLPPYPEIGADVSMEELLLLLKQRLELLHKQVRESGEKTP